MYSLNRINRYAWPIRVFFLALLHTNGVVIVAIFNICRFWFGPSSLELGILFRRRYFFIILHDTISKSPS